ncbi:MAG: hydrogenase nickel incorporation protein HypB [Leptospiraceae bacterium]|nr:hydrogenase nickel incorporation protein HypB [Leptospiraceae bacterium]MDW7976346.1 hydrogenase nickel incorporation protein HypB [Leptospiraceae bacterium]
MSTTTQTKEIKIVRNVLEKNNALANRIREILNEKRQSMFNFMSSPGAGKTMLLDKVIALLKQKGISVGVIEGDVQTDNDARKLQHHNIPIALINTSLFGGSCHLASNVVLGAIEELKDEEMDIILIENVGNLICPSSYDTGSDWNFVLLSVTEGEDKPLKYPSMFRKTQSAIITKMDLAEAVECDVELIKKNIHQINPNSKIFLTSAKKNIGLEEVVDFLIQTHQKKIERLQ